MSRTPESTVAAPARRRIDPLLAAIVGGAVLLIVAGLLALPLYRRMRHGHGVEGERAAAGRVGPRRVHRMGPAGAHPRRLGVV